MIALISLKSIGYQLQTEYWKNSRLLQSDFETITFSKREKRWTWRGITIENVLCKTCFHLAPFCSKPTIYPKLYSFSRRLADFLPLLNRTSILLNLTVWEKRLEKLKKIPRWPRKTRHNFLLVLCNQNSLNFNASFLRFVW